MHDLDFLAADAKLPSLVVYRYRTRAMRKAVLKRMAQAVAEQGSSLVRSDAQDLRVRLLGGGLFGSDRHVPYLDWDEWSTRQGKIEGDEEDELLDDKGSLAGLLRLARSRAIGATTAVFLVEASDENLDGFVAGPSELLIEATERISRADVGLLVDGLTASLELSSSRRDELIRFSSDLWFESENFETLCEDIETAAVSSFVKEKRPEAVRSARMARVTSKTIRPLRNMVWGTSGSLEALVELLGTHRNPVHLPRDVALLTSRLLKVSTITSQAPDAGALVNAGNTLSWVVIVLKYWGQLVDAANTVGVMWPRPSRSATVLLHMFEEMRDARSSAPWAISPQSLQRVMNGARQLRVDLPAIVDQLAIALTLLGEWAAATKIAGSEHVAIASADLVATLISSDEPIDGQSSAPEVQGAQLKSLDDLVGRRAVKFAFLQHFDERLSEPRAFARPFLLIGPDGVGKRVAADLLARLFVCDQATSDAPHTCGKCLGCISGDLRIAEVDTGQITASTEGERFFVERNRNRGTVGGAVVSIVRRIDLLSVSVAQRVLKSLEAQAGTGLAIFTTRDLENVPDALRSRCYEIHLWPLRRVEAEQLASRCAIDSDKKVSPAALAEIAVTSRGIPSRIVELIHSA